MNPFVAGHSRRLGIQTKNPLHVIQINPMTEHLGHPADAPGNRQTTAVIHMAKIAGGQLTIHRADTNILTALGIAQHHIRTRIHDLAHAVGVR